MQFKEFTSWRFKNCCSSCLRAMMGIWVPSIQPHTNGIRECVTCWKRNGSCKVSSFVVGKFTASANKFLITVLTTLLMQRDTVAFETPWASPFKRKEAPSSKIRRAIGTCRLGVNALLRLVSCCKNCPIESIRLLTCSTVNLNWSLKSYISKLTRSQKILGRRTCTCDTSSTLSLLLWFRTASSSELAISKIISISQPSLIQVRLQKLVIIISWKFCKTQSTVHS